jgi:hypothetical protein
VNHVILLRVLVARKKVYGYTEISNNADFGFAYMCCGLRKHRQQSFQPTLKAAGFSAQVGRVGLGAAEAVVVHFL